jgi:Transposase DDE domain
LDRRFAAAPPAPTNPTPLAAMVHRLATPHGKKLYARRKHTPEPGFGIIKSVLGFRQFLLRGLDKVRGEWSLVTMACNMKRILALATRPREHWAIVTQPPPGQPATLRQVSNRFSLALSTQLGVPALDQLNSSPTGC